MASDVEVQNAPAIMTDDEEAVQNPKGESGDGEEIHGRDSFPMIAQKGQPALGGLRVFGRSVHPAGNGSFRHVEAEHQESAREARRIACFPVAFGYVTVKTRARLVPPLVHPTSPEFPLGVLTVTFAVPGAEITAVVIVTCNCC